MNLQVLQTRVMCQVAASVHRLMILIHLCSASVSVQEVVCIITQFALISLLDDQHTQALAVVSSETIPPAVVRLSEIKCPYSLRDITDV